VELKERLAREESGSPARSTPPGEQVRHLMMGLAASLWRRRLPAGSGRRLWMFGPAPRRVMTAAGPVAFGSGSCPPCYMHHADRKVR